MPTPVVVFDHINKTVLQIGGDPSRDPRLAQMVAAQRDAVMTANGAKSSSE